ncbi:MAG: hypothetical protein JSS49_13640 [Planctomycetes bacterium]|nr:hypothetical protein [Planctomycetota bacterium]
MKSLLQTLARASAVAGLSLVATLSAVAQDDAPGIVRITKPSTAAMNVQPVSFGHGQMSVYQSYSDCPNGDCQPRHGCCRDPKRQAMVDYFRCKFGYFIPTGAGGAGVPIVGKYSRVYPQDPYYFDQRDGQAWGAQGYGMPMAVPLAPVVGHAYNYSWGSPSSRLTPISRPAY